MASKRTFREFKQGIFKPKNKQKCINKDQIVYRSGLECSFMLKLDNNPNVIQWSSESIIIPYFKSVENRSARYYVDFWFKIVLPDKTTKEFIVEIKPHRQTLPPTESKKKKASTILYENIMFKTNEDKWKAAQQWCSDYQKRGKNISFLIITEKNIDTILGTTK